MKYKGICSQLYVSIFLLTLAVMALFKIHKYCFLSMRKSYLLMSLQYLYFETISLDLFTQNFDVEKPDFLKIDFKVLNIEFLKEVCLL